jgi:hypothetical protein
MQYLQHMFVDFCDSIENNKYDVVIVDAVNAKISDFDLFYNKSQTDGWTVSLN